MILTGSEDIRVKKTMISIRNAFCDMICEMDYERITVKELCERALHTLLDNPSYHPSGYQ